MAIPEARKTIDGFEQQFGVNHLAHFTLTVLLLPSLIRSSTPAFNSRIVTVTSSGHRYSAINWEDVNLTHTYQPWLAYGQSKTANIWLSNYIDRVYGLQGVHANAVHPGGALTQLHKHVPSDMKAEWGKDEVMMANMRTPEQAASTVVWASVAKVWEGTGGKYLYNCSIGEPAKDLMSILDDGYAPHAFDEEGGKRLWDLSSKLTGVGVPHTGNNSKVSH